MSISNKGLLAKGELFSSIKVLRGFDAPLPLLSDFIVSPKADDTVAGVYSSVQAAVDAKAAAGGRDVILLMPGTYTEDVTIPSDSNIRLVGLAGQTQGRVAPVQLDGQLLVSGSNIDLWVANINLKCSDATKAATVLINSGGAAATDSTVVTFYNLQITSPDSDPTKHSLLADNTDFSTPNNVIIGGDEIRLRQIAEMGGSGTGRLQFSSTQSRFEDVTFNPTGSPTAAHVLEFSEGCRVVSGTFTISGETQTRIQDMLLLAACNFVLDLSTAGSFFQMNSCKMDLTGAADPIISLDSATLENCQITNTDIVNDAVIDWVESISGASSITANNVGFRNSINTLALTDGVVTPTASVGSI